MAVVAVRKVRRQCIFGARCLGTDSEQVRRKNDREFPHDVRGDIVASRSIAAARPGMRTTSFSGLRFDRPRNGSDHVGRKSDREFRHEIRGAIAARRSIAASRTFRGTNSATMCVAISWRVGALPLRGPECGLRPFPGYELHWPPSNSEHVGRKIDCELRHDVRGDIVARRASHATRNPCFAIYDLFEVSVNPSALLGARLAGDAQARFRPRL
jgi:hypothetical protein